MTKNAALKEIWTRTGWHAYQEGNKVIVTDPKGQQYVVNGWIDGARIYAPDGDVVVYGGPRYIVEISGLGKRVK